MLGIEGVGPLAVSDELCLGLPSWNDWHGDRWDCHGDLSLWRMHFRVEIGC